MTLSRRYIIIGAIALAAMLAGITYAINQMVVDRDTGQLTVDADEAVDIEVATYDGIDEVTDGSWCDGDLTAGVNCAARVYNRAESHSITVNIASTDVVDPDGLAPDTAVTVYRGPGDDFQACQNGPEGNNDFTEIGNGTLDDIDVDLGQALNPAGGANDNNKVVCFALEHDGEAYADDDATTFTTSATFSFTGTEQ